MFYTDNPAWGPYPGITIDSNVENLTISGNLFYNGGNNGFEAMYFSKLYRKNLTITKNFIASWGLGIIITGGYITDTLNITNNIIHTDKNMALYISDNKIPTGGVLNIFNNVILSESELDIFVPFGIEAGGSIIVKNNIIGRTTPGSVYYWRWDWPIYGTLICDNNIYWNATNGNPFILNGAARPWAYWNGVGNDTHGFNNTNPLFTNGSGLYKLETDFKLRSNSPALNNGTFVGLTLDYFDLPRYFQDIGAIEYRAE